MDKTSIEFVGVETELTVDETCREVCAHTGDFEGTWIGTFVWDKKIELGTRGHRVLAKGVLVREELCYYIV